MTARVATIVFLILGVVALLSAVSSAIRQDWIAAALHGFAALVIFAFTVAIYSSIVVGAESEERELRGRKK